MNKDRNYDELVCDNCGELVMYTTYDPPVGTFLCIKCYKKLKEEKDE